MAFFPLLNIKKASGFCTIHNFAPNNWESIEKNEKSLWALYSNGDKWISKDLGIIKIGESKNFNYTDIYDEGELEPGKHPIILLQFRKNPLVERLDQLPLHEITYSKVPEWRATVGFKIDQTQASYQGEINPFPINASLLTFHPFIQYNDVENYFLFINLEKYPNFRSSDIEIYEAKTKKFIDSFKVLSNNCNIINLDKYEFSQDELPVFVCRNMAGIPFGLGISEKSDMISLEHTHPPASFAVHGQRFKLQSEIKNSWFKILQK